MLSLLFEVIVLMIFIALFTYEKLFFCTGLMILILVAIIVQTIKKNKKDKITPIKGEKC